MAGLCADNASGIRRGWRAASSAARMGSMPMTEFELLEREFAEFRAELEEFWAHVNRRWTIMALILAVLIIGAAAANIAAVAIFWGGS